MKSKRKCDCGGELVCYSSIATKGVKLQSFKCKSCNLRMQVGQKVAFTRIKRPGEKVFSDLICTTIDASVVAS